MFKKYLFLGLLSSSVISTAFAGDCVEKPFPLKNQIIKNIPQSTNTQKLTDFTGTWVGGCSLNGSNQQTEWKISEPYCQTIAIRSNVKEIPDLEGATNAVSNIGLSDGLTLDGGLTYQQNNKFRLGPDKVLYADSVFAVTELVGQEVLPTFLTAVTTYAARLNGNQLLINGKVKALKAADDVVSTEFNCTLQKK
jgi:hypothetical protein